MYAVKVIENISEDVSGFSTVHKGNLEIDE